MFYKNILRRLCQIVRYAISGIDDGYQHALFLIALILMVINNDLIQGKRVSETNLTHFFGLYKPRLLSCKSISDFTIELSEPW